MAITWSGEVYEKDLAHEWIANPDNIKDIKENLKNLKWDILDKAKKDPSHEYFGKKISDGEDVLNKALDDEFATIDLAADNLFDKFAYSHENELNEIIRTSDNTQAQLLLKNLQTKFEDYLFNSSELKDKFTELKKIAGDSVRFEINDLRSTISVPSSYVPYTWTTSSNKDRNVFLDDWDNGNNWTRRVFKKWQRLSSINFKIKIYVRKRWKIGLFEW